MPRVPKIRPSLLLLLMVALVVPPAIARDYLYIPDLDQGIVDDAQGRRLLANVPGLDISKVWFITGKKYWEDEDHRCLRANDLWLFTKPAKSSPGIWRGKKAYYAQYPESACSQTIQASKPVEFNVDSATFTDPENFHPDPEWDGQVPGIFQIYDGITDDELTKLQSVIAQIHACLKGDEKCPYPISKEGLRMTKQYDLTPAIKVTRLLTMSIETEYYGSGKPCYSMIFAEDNWWDAAIGMSVCYRNETVSKVKLDDQILE